MKFLKREVAALIAVVLLAISPLGHALEETAQRPLPVAGKDGVIPVEWEDLIPADFDPERLYTDLKLDAMDDADPRAQEALKTLREAWDEAPTVAALEGKRVRIPGFVVPLESDGRHVAQFLLVPYVGACIHVPPPPANQMALVKTSGKGLPAGGLFEPVWVIGVLHTERTRSELGQAGYTIDASDVRPYDGNRPPY